MKVKFKTIRETESITERIWQRSLLDTCLFDTKDIRLLTNATVAFGKINLIYIY